MGEDVTDMATTTSQLQVKLLALTGGQVDIMASPTEFKNTTQILREMAGAWEDMNDIQRASALELMGGKRQANTLSALIQNFDTVEEAIEASAKSAGSALKENERYLDSIQGRIDQFNNALQSMWNNVLDDDLIKFIVQAGTELIKVVDNVGVLRTLIIGIGAYLIQKNFKGDLFGGIFNAQTIDEARDRLKNLQTDIAKLQKEGKKPKKIERKQNQANTLKASIDKYDELSKQLTKNRIDADAAKKALDDYNESLAKKYSQKENQGKSATAEEAAEVERLQKAYDGANDEVIKTEAALKQAEVQAKATGTAGLNAGNKIKTGFVSAGKAVWKFAKEMAMSMAYTMAFTAIFEAIGNIGEGLAPLFKNMDKSAEALQEKLSELENELSSVESELSNLQSELKDTDERIEELMSQGSLTFVEQEELNKLKSASAELKAQIGLQENLQKSMQQGVNSASVEATNAYLDTSFMSEQTRTEKQEKWGEQGEAIGQVVGTVGGAVFGAKVLGSIGSIGGPLGTAIGIAAGSIIGGIIGTFAGEGLAGAAYDSEQSVEEAMDSMLETRAKLKEDQDKALAENDVEAYNEATEALRTYDSQMAKHISQIQQNYNAMDWETASPEDRKEMMEYADWLDKYNISMGTAGAKSNAIARIFGDEAQGNIAKARDEINKLKENLTKAKKNGEGVDEALAALEGFELNLSEDEITRLREMGIYLYEVEDYFKNVVKTESEFIDNDLEDVAKDINKITDGLTSLKSAFEEVIEEGVLTAKTVMALKEELEIAKYSDVTDVTDAWRAYLDVMMSGTATTEEMTAATEELAQSIIEAALEDPNGLTPETKFEYVAQLKVLGVENAEEYVNDLLQKKLQKNMVKDLEAEFSVDKEAVRQAYEEEAKDVVGPVQSFDTFDDTKIRELAEYYGILGDISDDVKQDIMERYKVEEDVVDSIIGKLQEKAELEQQIADAQKAQSTYVKWLNGDDTNKGILALQEDLDSYKNIIDEYQSFSEEVKDFNSTDWTYHGDIKGGKYRGKTGYLNSKGEFMGVGKYNALAKESKEWEAWKRDNQEQYDEYLEIQKQYDALWAEGKSKGYIIDGEIVDPNFKEKIDKLNTELAGIKTEIDKELTVDIELKLDLQNKSELVDDIQNVFDTLVNAQKEYTKNGYISVDTLQSLLQLEPKYLDLLVDESGNLNLTKDALYNVARARITDMGIQSQKNILEKASALASEGSSEALREQITVMQNANEVGADFVEVEMAKIRAILAEKVAAGDLTQAEADAFVEGTMNQVKAVQVATQSALDNLNNSLSSSGNTATAEIEDAFQNAMSYWENRIGANQSLYEQIQNDNDLLEKQGKIAGESYYRAQMAVENERLEHLKKQRAEATQYLKSFKPGTEDWWEVANTLNDIENEIDDVTASLQDLSDAMAQVHWTIFDEAHERMDDLQTQLSNVRELLSADEDSFFTDEGEWTETGVAVLATHIQELELYKSTLADVSKEREAFDKSYAGNESYYKKMGIDSEQEYYDKLTELTEKQHEYTMAMSDSEQAVVEMYESSVDAIEEYTQTLVDSYNDYIDSVKEALDAERDLYGFKKNVQKQAKDIATIERRIASLSGSTNASDIAERRRLEADLYGAREELDDTYYDHAKETQQEALDFEAQAYEEHMTRFVEELHAGLEEATRNMGQFIASVTSMVSLNADAILQKYQSTELPLSTALTNPWEVAKEAAKGYSGDALDLMNEWTRDGGFFDTFNTTGSEDLKSPFDIGTKASEGFATSVGSSMASVYSSIKTNVQSSITELNKLKQKYAEINDTTVKPPSTGGDGDGGGDPPPKQYRYKATMTGIAPIGKATGVGYGTTVSEAKADAFESLKRNFAQSCTQEYGYGTEDISGAWTKVKNRPVTYEALASGTLNKKQSGFALTDELGPELKMYATPEGNLSFMALGSTVVPHDLTMDLIELPSVVDGLINRPKFDSGINMISNAINKPEIVIDVENFLKVDRVDKDTLPQLEAMMDKKIDTFAKQLNYSIKKFSR